MPGSVGFKFGLLAAILCATVAGCAPWGRFGGESVRANPVLIPIQDADYVWEHVVDVVDDYFVIDREERVKVVGDVITEGLIETKPVPGATLLEPWRRDSVDRYERLESTLQTIRRRCIVRVIPDSQGFLVEIVALKELEDLPRPEQTTAGAATFRYDDSLQRYRDPAGDPVQPLGWIPQGRDVPLEQAMLARLQATLGR
jgi:hypothetical protein